MNVSLDAVPLPRISILVKALNEAECIEACLRSALAAGAETQQPFEVLLADALSTDATVAIASKLPVRVVQLCDVADRGCGTGVQLGYQHARGEFVFLLDGDMTVCPGFLPAAVAELQADAQLAGVAGLMAEKAVRNFFDATRIEEGAANVARAERWLNGGGVYRCVAIDASGGYAADRNLKGWEEADLGMRLRSRGWRLKRLAIPGVEHDGHGVPVQTLLKSWWRSGRATSSGILLRKALTQPWLGDALALLSRPVATIAWWLLGLIAALVSAAHGGPLALWLLLTALVVLAVVLKRRSVKRGLASVFMWHFLAAGLLHGLATPVRPVLEPIRSVELAGRGR